jgi:rare lipoprotein A (peptidoglycan hydrolase)
VALTCLVAVAPAGASAENLFSILFAPTPRPATANAAPNLTASGWTATVFHSPQAAVAPVEARDPGWTVTVVALNTSEGMTTGSIARHEVAAARPGPRLTGHGHALSGVASYYWEDQMTATGEHFNKRALTAAHKTLPFGTRVRVTRTDNGDSVVVRINDRGPYISGRIIDLSERAAEDLGLTGIGTTPVRLEVLGR